MSATTVTGRVRPTLHLKRGDGGGEGAPGARVVESSWASDRRFPRTIGTGVTFELETGDGTVYRVDPFEALVTLPVRAADVRDGVRHEEGWIAAEDHITVEGQVERGRARLPPALRARRIALPGPSPAHRLPPFTLQRGEVERLEQPKDDRPERAKKKRPDPGGTPPPVA